MAVGDLMLKIKQKNLSRKGGDWMTEQKSSYFMWSQSVTLTISHMVENMDTVLTSVMNTNVYKHLQLSTATNTVKKSATGIPKSTLKLNLPLDLNVPLNIKLPTNIPPPAKKS